MNYSILFLFLFTVLLFPQSKTFFIKYRSSVPETNISSKVTNKVLFDTKIFKNLPEYDVEYLAKGIAKEDEILGRIIKVSFKSEIISESELMNLLNDPLVEYIQQARTYKVDYVPNDSLLADQWALNKIKAFDAWDITEGADTVLLAIIDTGIDYLHHDLNNKIAFNAGEEGQDQSGLDKKYNGIDDDDNGFIDDYMGWDFTDRLGFPFDSTGGDYLIWDNDPADFHGHGTLIAGTAAAEINNLTGIAGAAPRIKVLNIRALDPSGYGEEDDAAAAILYAVKRGAKVINMSFGDNSFSYVLRDVIRYAYSRNVVLVASSGNTNSDQPHYPSGYSEVISVGNSTDNDYVAGNSNWGSTIDLVAPGTNIQTTAINNSYNFASGTSLATPFVSATAALILSINNYSNDEIRQILKSTSDDINTVGWDQKSGAGRLNMLKALTVTAPSVIKFDHPKQDFATMQDSLLIKATVLSAYFIKYELYLGTGVTPADWNLLQSGQSQFNSSEIYNLNLSGLSDSIYTLRLVVYQSNGRTTEERVNFHLNRKPPVAQIITIGPALYGNESTILSSVYTEVPSIVKLFYRTSSEEHFRYITLDGFATNNKFVKYFHYGFIPKELLTPETEYEIYLEAENLTGLKTVLKDKENNFFIRTSFNSAFVPEFELPFSLPYGQLYEKPVNFKGDTTEILFNGIYEGEDLYYGIYSLTDNKFVKVDSIKNRIPRDVGDFNVNGKTDILSTFEREAFIDEQTSTGLTQLNNVLTDSSGSFWASKIEDIDKDGEPEVLVFSSDTTLTVWKMTNNFNRKKSTTLQNYSVKGPGANMFNHPRIITADLNNNGLRELWTVDNDGDILSYEVNGDSVLPIKVINTGLSGSAEYITSGDFNGDGKEDIAVLLKSFQDYYIAPFNYLLVFDEQNILFEQAILDPSTEFNTSFRTVWNSIKLADIDNDNKDELITFSFPYSYIFKHSDGDIKIISYKQNINSDVVFAGDLNGNGVIEIAFPSPGGIKFIEFTGSDKASQPLNVEGYSKDSLSVYLTWNGEGDKYFIYRGTGKDNISLYDSTSDLFYNDSVVINLRTFYYSVQAYNSLKEFNLSDLSPVISVYVHNKARVTSIESKSPNTLQVYFSEKINSTVLNLQNFFIQRTQQYSGDTIYPVSVSPATQYSYLLTFNSSLLTGSYRLYVNEMVDYYTSPLDNTFHEFSILAVVDPTEFYITSHKILNPYLIKVEFNLDVDSVSATDMNNYSFEPYNKIERIGTDVNKKIVYIYLEKQRPVGAIGREYTLSIQNFYSSQNSGRIKINSGAGSKVVLISFASDLSGLYVYPNPYKPGAGEQKITFAGLPQKSKIIIFNLNGEHLRTLNENNGDGGTDFDLMDTYGNSLNSGIYFFRVVQLDEFNNEVGEKLGKFAIIR